MTKKKSSDPKPSAQARVLELKNLLISDRIVNKEILRKHSRAGTQPPFAGKIELLERFAEFLVFAEAYAQRVEFDDNGTPSSEWTQATKDISKQRTWFGVAPVAVPVPVPEINPDSITYEVSSVPLNWAAFRSAGTYLWSIFLQCSKMYEPRRSAGNRQAESLRKAIRRSETFLESNVTKWLENRLMIQLDDELQKDADYILAEDRHRIVGRILVVADFWKGRGRDLAQRVKVRLRSLPKSTT